MSERGTLARAQIAVTGVLLGGCDRAPTVTVLGAYFPAWMLCILVGGGLMLVAWRLLVAAGLDAAFGPRGLVYPALALVFTLLVWVIFFRG
ncbi:MAG TPA: YtcA family lipoprotein [Caldimonas sp.]|nr:YtcA family lipoprotein [Caldimonas sp.]